MIHVAETKNLPRPCQQKSAHAPHEYAYIDLGGRNISFGQTFDCPGKVGAKLTKNETALLEVIGLGWSAWYTYCRTDRRTPQGCHRSAASLVRKGMLIKRNTSDGVFYRLTPLARDTMRGT